MTIFNSDIMDTFTCSNNNIRNELLEKFIKNIEDISYELNLSNILFSFYSTDDIDEILTYKNELKNIIEKFNSNLTIDNVYGEKQKLANGKLVNLNTNLNNKIDQMMNQVKIYENNNINIDRIIYADDSLINQRIFRYLLAEIRPDIEFISLVPSCQLDVNDDNYFISSNNGLIGLNECMKDYLQSIKKDKGLSK